MDPEKYALPCPPNDSILEEFGPLVLKRAGLNRVRQFVEFALTHFEKTLGVRAKLRLSGRMLDEAVQEEIEYSRNGMYAILETKQGEILGTFRAVRHSDEYRLPTEKLFDFSVKRVAEDLSVEPSTVWHGSYYAVDVRGLKERGLPIESVMESIYFHSVASLVASRARILIGEVDSRILRVHERFGFKWQPFAGPQECWGSVYAARLDVLATASHERYCSRLRTLFPNPW